MNYYVYILTNYNNNIFYIGMTNNIERRIYEHKNKLIPGFTSKYNTNKLVYLEQFNNVLDAISNEKRIKGWTRNKKINLIESLNPKWNDLSSNDTHDNLIN